MRVDEARKVLLVRAVEMADGDGSLISDSMRLQAERQARDVADPRVGREEFLAARAGRLYERIAGESRSLRLMGQPSRHGGSLIAICCVISLLIGFGLNELGTTRAINVLSAPILVLIAWNVLVCLIGIVGVGFGCRSSRSHGPAMLLSDVLHWLADRLPLRYARKGHKAKLAVDAAHGFLAQWFDHGRPMHVAQTRLMLHVIAGSLVVGAVGGMYLRGLAFEYQATWESTFLDADSVRSILGVVLGPASAILGRPIPDVDAFEAMKIAPAPAAIWIHRYALTTLLFVIAPRIVLAGVDLTRLRRLRRTFPLDWQSDQYFLRLLAPYRGDGAVVRVQPYSFTPAEESMAALSKQLRTCFGERTDISVATTLEYGDEVELLDGTASGSPVNIPEAPTGACQVLLFNLAQTPEREVHGRLAAAFANAADDRQGRLLVLIDETAFRQRHGSDAQAERRVEQRRTAWLQVLEEHGVDQRSVVAGALEDLELTEGVLNDGS